MHSRKDTLVLSINKVINYKIIETNACMYNVSDKLYEPILRKENYEPKKIKCGCKRLPLFKMAV